MELFKKMGEVISKTETFQRGKEKIRSGADSVAKKIPEPILDIAKLAGNAAIETAKTKNENRVANKEKKREEKDKEENILNIMKNNYDYQLLKTILIDLLENENNDQILIEYIDNTFIELLSSGKNYDSEEFNSEFHTTLSIIIKKKKLDTFKMSLFSIYDKMQKEIN